MKVREERVLADRQLAKSGAQVDELLRACWEETLDPGPYSISGEVDWGKVLQGDRFFALLHVRAATYGPEYAFAVSCENPRCRARIDWEIDLAELPVRPLADESRASFVSANRFETVLPDSGDRLTFRLLTGADERKLPQLQKSAGDRFLSPALAFRIVTVNGEVLSDRMRFVEDLSLRDADFLVDEFDRVDCGVDTTIEIECPHCLAVQEVELPFDKGFFLPGKERTARRRARSASSPK
jgi:hypothetical protein